MPALPFDGSRRLTGANLFFAGTAAVLDVGIELAMDDGLLAEWHSRTQQAATHLQWKVLKAAARRHAVGASLAVAAPRELLMLATEINEWALCAALVARDGERWHGLEAALVAEWRDSHEAAADPEASLIPVLDTPAALARFQALAVLESIPLLRPLLSAANARPLSCLLDDTELTLGAGRGGRTFPLTALPTAAELDWDALHEIPTALVTGSNGKTTTVRLIAGCARAHGWRVGYNCTDGVYIGDSQWAAGDYSGPAGARLVLRERSTEAAVLETARGGILRRGVAVARADAAVVTNVTSDHFGEYGIDDLPGLADVKLSVGAVVPPPGLLVMNADDPLLVSKAQELARRFSFDPALGWFAVDADHPLLMRGRARGDAVCGVREDHLWLSHRGAEHDLGAVSAMPLSIGGVARYNVANLAAAALAAAALGIEPATLAAVFAQFGDRLTDNPGRMMSFDIDGTRVLIDYAHNPEGLRGFLTVAEHWRAGAGRLGILLGQAGNRNDADVEALARVAAEFRPALIVVKENETQLRGRAPGEIPRILRAELLRQHFPESALPVCSTEFDAVRYALNWARPGDVLALPVHSSASRAAAVAMLQDRARGT